MPISTTARTLILSMTVTVALLLLTGIEQALGDRLMAITVALIALVAVAGLFGPLLQFSPRRSGHRMEN